jgi:hypothetical protein
MQFYIPSIGDQIKLTEDWEFPLIAEYRQTLLERIKTAKGEEYSRWRSWDEKDEQLLVTLEAGTVLRIDRIYIRKGKSEWDSVTFVIKEAPGDKDRPADKKCKFKGARFWAKLEDVNEIEFEKVEE